MGEGDCCVLTNHCRGPQLWMEGEGECHHYVVRRKIPLAIMVGCNSDRVGPQLWPPGAGGWGEGRVREMAIIINIGMLHFAR